MSAAVGVRGIRPLKTVSPGIHIGHVTPWHVCAESGIKVCLDSGFILIVLWVYWMVEVDVDCDFEWWCTVMSAEDQKIGFISWNSGNRRGWVPSKCVKSAGWFLFGSEKLCCDMCWKFKVKWCAKIQFCNWSLQSAKRREKVHQQVDMMVCAKSWVLMGPPHVTITGRGSLRVHNQLLSNYSR